MQLKRDIPGDSPLIHAEKLEKFLEIGGLYIKYEGSNPTGTQKDRIASLHVQKAIEEGFDTIVVASCGNYGAATAYYAFQNNLKSRIYIPRNSHSPRLKEIEKKYGAKLVLSDGLYEDSVEVSKKEAKDNGWFDGNAGVHTDLNLEAYSKISSEIYDSILEVPETVSVPVGNGTTLAGVYQGFADLRRTAITRTIPKMIAASTDGGNPIIESFRNSQSDITDFPKERIKESDINEPLVNFHSYDGELAFKALVESNGFAEYVTDDEMKSYKDLLKKYEGIDAIPAAVASIVATVRVVKANKLSGIHVAVLTGRS